ncbi:MAG: sugar phosphate isomerase/epimerase family protein [Butyricicoccaceae bacterium]
MAIYITGAPICWETGHDEATGLKPWQQVIRKAGESGLKAVELGPYGYFPNDIELLRKEFSSNGVSIAAGTIMDDFLTERNYDNLLRQVNKVCSIIANLPPLPYESGQHFKAPYLVIADWGHEERDCAAWHSGLAPRLDDTQWEQLAEHIRGVCRQAAKWGIRVVIHPHIEGYLAFGDEIDRIMKEIAPEYAGLCLDIGQMVYSGLHPTEWLRKYADRLDYIHFNDVSSTMFRQAMERGLRFSESRKKGVLCQVGTGSVDFSSIRHLLEDELHYNGYIAIEQKPSEFWDINQSLAYLKCVGF